MFKSVSTSGATIVCGSAECFKAVLWVTCFPKLQHVLATFTDPGVRQHIFKGDSLEAVLLEETQDQVLSVRGHIVPDGVVERHGVIDGLTSCLLVIVAVKRQHATQQHIDDDTKAPQVNILAIGSLHEYFRCNIGQSTEGIIGGLSGSNHL